MAEPVVVTVPYHWPYFAGEWNDSPLRQLAQCPFCHSSLSLRPCGDTDRVKVRVALKTCECGWWCCWFFGDYCNDGFCRSYVGLIRSFAPDSAIVPLAVLREELRQSVAAAHAVEPGQFQRLIADILRTVWDCEVVDLGVTRDGGIDLLALRGASEVVAVQVKRRESERSAESVAVVREFLGAGLLRGHNDLTLITTATRFTRGARQEAQTAVDHRLVRRFQLLDRASLRDLLDACPSREPWEAALADGIPRPARNGDLNALIQQQTPEIAHLLEHHGWR